MNDIHNSESAIRDLSIEEEIERDYDVDDIMDFVFQDELNDFEIESEEIYCSCTYYHSEISWIIFFDTYTSTSK